MTRPVQEPVLGYLTEPEGSANRMLEIAIGARAERFEEVLKAAAPIVDSIEFHAP